MLKQWTGCISWTNFQHVDIALQIAAIYPRSFAEFKSNMHQMYQMETIRTMGKDARVTAMPNKAGETKLQILDCNGYQKNKRLTIVNHVISTTAV